MRKPPALPDVSRLRALLLGPGQGEDAYEPDSVQCDWTTLAGWRGLKTRLNSLRYTKGIARG